MPTIIDDWKVTLKHAWSVRILLASIVLNGIAAALMFGDALPIPPVWLFVVTLAVNIAAGVARFVAQKELP